MLAVEHVRLTDGSRAGPRAAHRGLGGRALPRHVVDVGSRRPRRVRPRGQRRQPVHRRLPDRGGAGRAHRRGPRVHQGGVASWTGSRPRSATPSRVRPGSAAILHDLERTNLFLVPLDEKRTWFRFHHLFASVARSELEFEHPERVPALHSTRRALVPRPRPRRRGGDALAGLRQHHARRRCWCRPTGSSTSAPGARPRCSGGSTRWGRQSIAKDPAARVTAAWMAAMSGDAGSARRSPGRAGAVRGLGPLPDGARSVESAIAMIQGIFGYGGPVEMTTGAQRALELETDGRSPFYSIAHMARGHAAYVARGPRPGHHPARQGRAQRGGAGHHPRAEPVHLVAGRGRARPPRRSAGSSPQQAMDVVETTGLGGMPQASLAFSALGQAQAAAGDLAEAAATIERGLVLRRKNPTQGPWGGLHHLLAAVNVAVRTGETARAHHLADEATVRMDRYPVGMECMRERLGRSLAVFATQGASSGGRAADRARAGRAAAAPGLAESQRDRGGAVHLRQHGQDPRQGGLPEAGRERLGRRPS